MVLFGPLRKPGPAGKAVDVRPDKHGRVSGKADLQQLVLRQRGVQGAKLGAGGRWGARTAGPVGKKQDQGDLQEKENGGRAQETPARPDGGFHAGRVHGRGPKAVGRCATVTSVMPAWRASNSKCVTRWSSADLSAHKTRVSFFPCWAVLWARLVNAASNSASCTALFSKKHCPSESIATATVGFSVPDQPAPSGSFDRDAGGVEQGAEQHENHQQHHDAHDGRRVERSAKEPGVTLESHARRDSSGPESETMERISLEACSMSRTILLTRLTR